MYLNNQKNLFNFILNQGNLIFIINFLNYNFYYHSQNYYKEPFLYNFKINDKDFVVFPNLNPYLLILLNLNFKMINFLKNHQNLIYFQKDLKLIIKPFIKINLLFISIMIKDYILNSILSNLEEIELNLNF